MTDFDIEILRLLEEHAVGRAHAIQADVIATLIGSTWRRVMQSIEDMRRAGVFIASARTGHPRGIYLPATEEEQKHALGSFRQAALSGITTYNCLKKARRLQLRHAGQQELF